MLIFNDFVKNCIVYLLLIILVLDYYLESTS